MKQLLKYSLLSAQLISFAWAETPAESSKAPEAPAEAPKPTETTTETTKTDETPVDTTSKATPAKADEDSAKLEARKMRRLERAKKVQESCSNELKELESQVQQASGVQKKKAELAIKHAKLDLEYSQDSELANESLWLARQCKKNLFKTKKILGYNKTEQMENKLEMKESA